MHSRLKELFSIQEKCSDGDSVDIAIRFPEWRGAESEQSVLGRKIGDIRIPGARTTDTTQIFHNIASGRVCWWMGG